MPRSVLLPGIAGLFLLVAGAALLVELTGLRDSRDQFQTRQVPADMLAGSRTGGVLSRLGLLNVVPNDGERFGPTHSGELDLGTGLFPRRRRVGAQLYSTEPVSTDQLPSTTSVPESAVADGLPIVSVSVLERDLHDEQRGLYPNNLKKGRDWERRAFVSYFNEGRLEFGSGVGLRLHGGSARHADKKSFRLMFRDEYGADRFPPGALFSPGIDPLTSFVLDAAKADATQILDPIALDVSRMVGAIAPETRPVRFFLNGRDMGVYIAMEHISRRYLRAHYGHDNFTMVRTKHFEKVSGNGEDYWDFHMWVKQTAFTMRDLAERVDIENFARWVISQLLCLTVDHDQGPALRNDSAGSDGRWFYINWDMDTTFGIGGRHGPRPWLSDDVRVFGLGTTRKTMLTRMHADPEWQAYFLRLFVDILNHEFTPERIDEVINRYASMVDRFSLGEPGRNVLTTVRKVLDHRPAVMRLWMQKHFPVEGPHRLTLQAPERLQLEIDGYAKEGSYTGWYFADMPVTIRPRGGTRRIEGWLVGGEQRQGAELEIPSLTRHLVIEPVFPGKQASRRASGRGAGAST